MSIPFVTIYAGLGRFHKLKAMLLTIPIVKKSIPTVLTFVAVLPFLYETPMAVIKVTKDITPVPIPINSLFPPFAKANNP